MIIGWDQSISRSFSIFIHRLSTIIQKYEDESCEDLEWELGLEGSLCGRVKKYSRWESNRTTFGLVANALPTELLELPWMSYSNKRIRCGLWKNEQDAIPWHEDLSMVIDTTWKIFKVGVEPTTLGVWNQCSSAELLELSTITDNPCICNTLWWF